MKTNLKPSHRIAEQLLWLKENGYDASWQEREPLYWKILDEMHAKIEALEERLRVDSEPNEIIDQIL